jgi:hypothetical protein
MATRQELKQQLDNDIAADILGKPTMSYADIGKVYGVSVFYVSQIAIARKIRRPTGMASPAWKRKQAV